MMRNLAITVVSMVLTSIVIGNAYYQKKQFYPSVVYITKSNPSMAVIYIQACIVVILLGYLMRFIFFGELRGVELEHLLERLWYAITETCLAFTVFRDDFNQKFLGLFTILLFLKAFHWLADERVDFMERSPVISWLFHIRVVSLLILLGILDMLFIYHAYQSTLSKGASVQLVFGFEYAILSTIVINIVIKYVFHVYDYHELPWENKAVFLLYTELIMGFIKVILYFLFVIIMVRIYTLPLFAFRPMYFTIRAFQKAVNDVIMSRRAIRNMNTLYPDATAEELGAMDNVCIICREEMRSAAKKLPCNHIFHTSCLRSWFQRQQTCPTCRLNILHTPSNPVAAAQQIGGQGAGAGAQQQQQAQQQHQHQPVPGGVGDNGDRHADRPGQQPATSFRDSNAQTVLSGAPSVGTSTANGGQIFRDQSASNSGAANQTTNRYTLHGQSSTNPVGNQGQNDIAGEQTHSTGFVFSPIPQYNQDHLPLIPPFPFTAFNVPPPIPPAEGFSDEELRRLEQNTRESMEQRIRYLYSIQAMLDTSIFMMHQYSAAVAAASSDYRFSRRRPSITLGEDDQPPPVPSTEAKNDEPTDATSETEGLENVKAGSSREQDETPTAATSLSPNPTSSSQHPNEDKITSELTNSSSGETCSETERSKEQEILRKRRLQKFSKQD